MIIENNNELNILITKVDDKYIIQPDGSSDKDLTFIHETMEGLLDQIKEWITTDLDNNEEGE